VASPAAGLWSLAFRPFFVAAAIWAAQALALYPALKLAVRDQHSLFGPTSC
jgi:uncharacterized protein involved in response to NO